MRQVRRSELRKQRGEKDGHLRVGEVAEDALEEGEGRAQEACAGSAPPCRGPPSDARNECHPR